jgi:hypothetical protein
MTDEPFGRQPQPVKVVIASSDLQDQNAAVTLISRFLNNQFDNINCYHNDVGNYVIDCYPRAVND